MTARLLTLITFVSALSAVPGVASALCDWTVQGRIQVLEDELQATRIARDLARVEVRVSGSTLNSGGYRIWDTVPTTEDGRFSVAVRRSCADRNLRVKVRLRNDDLRVVDPTGSEWNVVYQTGSRISGPAVDVGTLRFTEVTGLGALSNRGNYRRAVTWYMLDRVMQELESRDPWLGFNHTIRVRYPANVISGSSYANGIEWTAFIHASGGRDQWSPRVVLHEVMHLWNYDHNSGTTDWLAAVWGDQSTHSFQEQPNVAFHEGFAEYAARALLHELWGQPLPTYFSRAQLLSRNLTTPAIVERNDTGVERALYLLTAQNIYPSLAGCPASPNLTLWDVLAAFRAGPGWPTEWQVGNSSYGLFRFYDRIADFEPSFDDADKALYLALLDASSTVEPASLCTSSLTPAIIRPRTPAVGTRRR